MFKSCYFVNFVFVFIKLTKPILKLIEVLGNIWKNHQNPLIDTNLLHIIKLLSRGAVLNALNVIVVIGVNAMNAYSLKEILLSPV